MERAAEVNKKVLALLLKPASPTPSNTCMVSKLFHRDTENRIKVLRYSEVLQRGIE